MIYCFLFTFAQVTSTQESPTPPFELAKSKDSIPYTSQAKKLPSLIPKTSTLEN